MQDRYAGDIGDYIKLALLRALAGKDLRLGVGWYRTTSDDSNDGRHVGYLGLDPASPHRRRVAAAWRNLDTDLYDALRQIVVTDDRRIAALAPLLPPGTRFHDAIVDTGIARAEWFAGLREAIVDCDLRFVDPDNGIAPDGYRPGGVKAGKNIPIGEIRGLGWRPLIVYHHQTRAKGGHHEEIKRIGAQLCQETEGCVAAIRAKSYSPSVFFLINFDKLLWSRAEHFAAAWPRWLDFHVIDGPPDSLGLPRRSPYGDRAEMASIALGKQVDAGEYDSLIRGGLASDLTMGGQ